MNCHWWESGFFAGNASNVANHYQTFHFDQLVNWIASNLLRLRLEDCNQWSCLGIPKGTMFQIMRIIVNRFIWIWLEIDSNWILGIFWLIMAINLSSETSVSCVAIGVHWHYGVGHKRMSFCRSEHCQESLNRPLFTSFHVRSICCNAAMHRSNLLIHSLPENRLQSVNVDFVEKFSDSRKKFIYRPELLPWRRLMRCPNKKQENVKGS
jgi:hypothetical protein